MPGIKGPAFLKARTNVSEEISVPWVPPGAGQGEQVGWGGRWEERQLWREPGDPWRCRWQLASPLVCWLEVHTLPALHLWGWGRGRPLSSSSLEDQHAKIDGAIWNPAKFPGGAQNPESHGLHYSPRLARWVPSSGRAGGAEALPLGDTRRSSFLESFDVMAARNPLSVTRCVRALQV